MKTLWRLARTDFAPTKLKQRLFVVYASHSVPIMRGSRMRLAHRRKQERFVPNCALEHPEPECLGDCWGRPASLKESEDYRTFGGSRLTVTVLLGC